MSANSNPDEDDAPLLSDEHSDHIIRSLHQDLQNQRIQRAQDTLLVETKAAKIKQWVTSRLQELEEQNERLRDQNQKCVKQLQVLQTCSNNTAMWRSSLLMCSSTEGSAMSASMQEGNKSSSDDSGTTSDVPPDSGLQWPHVDWQKKTASVEKILSCSTNSIRTENHVYTSVLRREPQQLSQSATGRLVTASSNPGSPIHKRHLKQRKPADTSAGTQSLPRNSCRSTDLKSPGRTEKPVPKPRRNAGVGADMERDSLEINSRPRGEPSPIGHLTAAMDSICRDSLNSDYVNLSSLQSFGFQNYYHGVASAMVSPPEIPVPEPPAHKAVPLWEKKLHSLASQCFPTATDDKERKSMFSVCETPKKSLRSDSGEGQTLARNNSSGSSGYTLGVIAIKQQKVRSDQTAGHQFSDPSNTASTDLDYPDSNSLPCTSGTSSSLGEGGSRSSASSIQRATHPTRPNGAQQMVQSSSEEDDYAIPPDAYEQSPTPQLMDESALAHSLQDEPRKPVFTVPLYDVSIDADTCPAKFFQISWNNGAHTVSADTPASTQEWLISFQKLVSAASDLKLRKRLSEGIDGIVEGFLTKVKYGQTKRFYAKLVDSSVVFFKSSISKVPLSKMHIRGAHVQEILHSSDEDSGSDKDVQPDCKSFTISIQKAAHEPVYLVFQNNEDKEKWLYHLKLASRDGALYGTPFEVLVQRLMAVNGNPGSELWSDLLFTTCEEAPKEPLTTLHETLAKDAVSLYKSCQLFTTIPMQAGAIQYHVDLAQGSLAQVVRRPELRNELFAQLIKLSGGQLPGRIQAWQLLSLAVSLFSPSHYSVLWLLRKHLERWSISSGCAQGRLAFYCQRALQRCMEKGPRKEAPSRLETLSLLSKDPCYHSRPHSIPVNLPDDSYQVVGFDGSSTTEECLKSVCCSKSVRPPLLSGFALYSDDPVDTQIYRYLHPKHKICDIISSWERHLTEKAGKISTSKVITISLKDRFYWPSLTAGETDHERVYRAYIAGRDLNAGRFPISPDLAEHLTALLAQMHYGDFSGLEAERFNELVSKFYPEKMLQVACRNTLREKLAEAWKSMVGMATHDCARVLLQVLSKWEFFGCRMFAAKMRWKSEECVWIAINHSGLHLLSSANQMERLASYAYSSIVQFGAYRDDFMLTVGRRKPADGEPSKDRLVFAMSKADVGDATRLVSDYLSARTRLFPSRSPLANRHKTSERFDKRR